MHRNNQRWRPDPDTGLSMKVHLSGCANEHEKAPCDSCVASATCETSVVPSKGSTAMSTCTNNNAIFNTITRQTLQRRRPTSVIQLQDWKHTAIEDHLPSRPAVQLQDLLNRQAYLGVDTCADLLTAVQHGSLLQAVMSHINACHDDLSPSLSRSLTV